MDTIMSFYNELGAKILRLSLEHLELTFAGMFIAIIIAVPLGIIVAKTKRQFVQTATLSSISMVQTIPSLALIAFVMILFKAIGLQTVGFLPAVTALVVYALLPIVRNTYTGITQVEPATVEVAKSMGMTPAQILFKVELPLAVPVIMTGIKISTTWTIGLVTLVSLIGAGGLGDLIFSGIRNVRDSYIIAGAVPAAVMALVAEWALNKLEIFMVPDGLNPKFLESDGVKKSRFKTKTKVIAVVTILLIIIGTIFSSCLKKSSQTGISSGFEAEFIVRPDGLPGLYKKYDFKFNLPPKHLDTGLMYKACKLGSVDVICAYSTDGRIPVFNLCMLKDDKQFFPPYYATPIVRKDTLKKYPQLKTIFKKIEGKITEEDMQKMNYSVSRKDNPISPEKAARDFLLAKNLITADSVKGDGSAGTVVVGSKDYTEQSIIGEMISMLIEYNSNLKVDRKLKLGGTMICFNAIDSGDLDLYVDYTGTLLMSVLGKEKVTSPQKAYDICAKELDKKYNIQIFPSLGFNNTYTLTVRKSFSDKHKIKSISDLVKLLKQNK